MDSEEGEGGDYMEDVTNPPPFLDLGEEPGRAEEEWGRHKLRRPGGSGAKVASDIELVEEEVHREPGRGREGVRGGTAGARAAVPSPVLLLLLLLPFQGRAKLR